MEYAFYLVCVAIGVGIDRVILAIKNAQKPAVSVPVAAPKRKYTKKAVTEDKAKVNPVIVQQRTNGVTDHFN